MVSSLVSREAAYEPHWRPFRRDLGETTLLRSHNLSILDLYPTRMGRWSSLASGMRISHSTTVIDN